MKRSNVIGILAAAAVIVLSVVLISWYLTKRTPTLIQGTVECTTYKASSKVPGRIDDMKVAQGDRVEKGQLLIGEEAVLSVRGVEDQPLTVGIRPEGFLLREDGPLSLDLVRVEVMGRDISVVSTSEVSINPTVRSIIDAEMRLKVKEEKVHFALRPSKVLLFHKETEERIYPEEAE